MTKMMQFKRGLNLESLSADPSNPAEGDLYFSDGTARAKGLWQYKDGAWTEIGSGGGGLDTFLAEDFSSNDASSITSGQNATFDNGGSLGGVIADEEVNQIAGDRSIKYTTNASATASNNDFFYLSAITLDDKQKGQDIGLTFYYTWDGSDDLIEVVIYDDTNNTVLSSSLDLIKAKSNPTRFSTTVYVPTSCNALKVGFHHTGTSEASKVLVFDDVELSTNPFVYKQLSNMTDWTQYTPTTAGFGTTVDNNFYYKRVGDSCLIQATFQAGTTDTNTATVSLPSGLTASSKYQSSTNNVGSWVRSVSTGDNGGVVLVIPGETSIKFSSAGVYGSSSNTALTPQLGGNVMGSSEIMSLFAEVKIEGWTSTTEHVVTPAKSNLTDWESYTPTLEGLGTVTNLQAQYKRVGSDLIARGWANAGTPTAVALTISLPSGLEIDELRLAAGSNKRNRVGEITRIEAGSRHYSGGGIAHTETSVSLTKIYYSTLPSFDNEFTTNVGTDFASGDGIAWEFRVPIAGWDSGSTFLAAVPVQKVAVISETQSAGASSSTSLTSGAAVTRVLNTVEGDSEIVSLSSNQVTLQPGEYKITCWGNSGFVYSTGGVHTHFSKIGLYDVTNSTYLKYGSGVRCNVSKTAGEEQYQFTSRFDGYKLTISESTTLELRHLSSFSGSGSQNAGLAIGLVSSDEVYCEMEITKLR